MITIVATTRRLAGLGLALASLVAVPTPAAAGTCPPVVVLDSGVSVDTAADPSTYSVTSQWGRWSAVGVRTQGGGAWNIAAYDEAGPGCVSGDLAASATPSLDFLVADGHYRPAGADYIVVSTPDGNEPAARVEFEEGDYVQTNMAFLGFTMANQEVLRPIECAMLATVSYSIEIVVPEGSTGFKLFVFQPVTSGSGWLARSDAQIELGLAGGSNGLNYTPTVNGAHAFVLVNENAESGTCYFKIGQCPISSSILTSNAPFFIPGLLEFPNFTPDVHSWGVVAVRGEPGYTYLVNVSPGLRRHDALYNASCTDSILAYQYDGIVAHLVTGDFRTLPLRTYTSQAGMKYPFYPTTSGGYMEWENGEDSLTVDAAPIAVTPPAHNVIDAWRIRLSPAASYDFHLTPATGSTAIYRLALVGNPNPGSEFWANRNEVAFESDGSGNYHPIRDDVFGLFVINDNGGSGDYTLSVTSSVVDVPAGALSVTSRIRSASPNPTAGGASIAFELAHEASASIAVRDARGRLVASVPLGMRPAGPGSVAWDALGPNGQRLPAAVYFLVLMLDGKATAGRKLVVIGD